MHSTLFRIIFFLLTLITNKKIAKTKASFLLILDKYLLNGLFCYNYNT